MNRITKLIQLSAKADQLINFAYNDEEENEGHLLRNTAIAGAAGAGGLYAAGRGAIGPVQPGLAGIGQTISQGASRVGGAVSSAAGGMKDTFMKGYGKGGIMRGIRGLARSLTKGKSRFVGLSSRSALVQLNAKLDDAIQFKMRNITGNLYEDEGNLYTPASGVKPGSDMLNYPHLQKDGMVRVVNSDGSVSYQSRGAAKALGGIGGSMIGGAVGAGGALGHAVASGKAFTGKRALIASGIGSAAGAGIGVIRGATKKLPQDR
jgi:hypothetical protein